MEHMLVCILLIQWITLVHLAFSTAVTEVYLGVGWCSFHTYKVNEAQYYEIVWEGSDLPLSCRIGFEGRNAHDVYDQYQVCVEASEYHVSDCTFHMKYYDPGRRQKQLSYSCGFGPGKYCAVENENFVIEFSNFRTSTSVVRLMVTAKKTYDYEPPLLAAVVGGVLGGAVIITVVAVVVIMFRIRKRRWRKPPPVHVPLPPPDPDRETCV
ncbi:uncharacterized protein LOC110465426 isoform X2 [Mizuhopecten yessoensis]|uniref:uncharacterized protein LOC110465426 isoform X2 n=1 Tax=Mizuhopecten yessoensis TaxID=6573 RepID=UPI000B45F6F3|nr:uncharacterized protein LOC110465426 isoform X2 [Mizuhopecten yessoensis]